MPRAPDATETSALLLGRGVRGPDVLTEWEESLRAVRRDHYLPASECAALTGQCKSADAGFLLRLPSGVRFSLAEAIRHALAPLTREQEGASLLLFGATNNYGGFLYLREDGAVFEVGAQAGASCRLVAGSPWLYLERTILREQSAEALALLRCDRPGAPLAERLGIPLATEASDAEETYHADASVVVRELDGGWSELSLLALDGDLASRLVSALGALSMRARIERVRATRELLPLASAMPLAAPAPPNARLWTFGEIAGYLAARGQGLVAVEGRSLATREWVVENRAARATVRTLLAEGSLPPLSGRARAYLLASQARRDPIDIPTREELLALLERWGLPSYPALVQANLTWSGLAWSSQPGTILGTFSLLLEHFPGPAQPLSKQPPPRRPNLSMSWQGRELATIGGSAETLLYLDHDGGVIEYSTIDHQAFPSAGSLTTRIEFEALLDFVVTHLGHTHEAACAGSVGATLARHAGLSAVPEATDAVRAWWVGEHASISEHYSVVDGGRITAILTHDPALVDELRAHGDYFVRRR